MILTGFEVGVGVARVLLLGIGTITGSCQHCRQSLRRCSECDKIHSEAGYSRAATPKAYLWLAGNDEMEKKQGNYDNRLCRDYCKDPFRHS